MDRRDCSCKWGRYYCICGVKDINDIINCKENGNIAGCIVGKAFYEGTLDLEEGFKVL